MPHDTSRVIPYKEISIDRQSVALLVALATAVFSISLGFSDKPFLVYDC